jgi:SAM-dependent methyltransferase
MANKAWFETWFDSPYYHLLYQNRNDEEASRFIGNLLSELDLPKSAKVLDLACGKGRHSVTLASYGLDVTGVDLSPNSISSAKSFENERLKFEVRDMRIPFEENVFDAVFNLFTSFGYFDGLNDNQKVVASIRTMLVADGILVIDFMNSKRVITNLVESETKVIDGITFNIERVYDGSHIHKHIRFEAEGQDLYFTERVQALMQEDFQSLLNAGGFEIIRTFGDFDLNAYHAETSDRLILIAKRS